MTYIKFRPTSTRELLRDSMMPKNVMSAFDSLFNENAGKFERNVPDSYRGFTPRTDVVEKTKTFNLHIVLPGLKKDEIKIAVDGDTLTISGERKANTENSDEKVHLQESFYGKFSRSFNLPENVDKQNIEAELVDGILQLSIPKIEVTENKTTITIK